MSVYIYVGPSIVTKSLRSKSLKPKNPDSLCTSKCCVTTKDNKLQCTCGEEGIHEWGWETISTSTNIRISSDNKEVLFHPVYSSGTAAVRGQSPLTRNMHHYWEVKMMTGLYGTDVMVGVGTAKVIFSEWELRFCSLLGIDGESWGYSYHGNIQHNRLSRRYGLQFGIGSLVGVHVDMCLGTLEYYLNRKPLGIAFHGLKQLELYPMVCSTAAQSVMKISVAQSTAPTLQMKCLQVINKYPTLVQELSHIPGLVNMVKQKYFWLMSHLVLGKDTSCEENPLALEDQVVLSNGFDSKHCKRLKISKNEDCLSNPDFPRCSHCSDAPSRPTESIYCDRIS